MGCDAYINDDLLDDPWCQSCIDSYLDITDKDTDKDYLMAEKEGVWSSAYEEIYIPMILTPSSDVPLFDQFVALSVRWSFFNRHLYESTSVELDEEYAELMFDWWTVT